MAFPCGGYGSSNQQISWVPSSKVQAKKKLLKDFWSKKDIFIFPIHWQKSHWFTVRGNKATSSWEIYDSIIDTTATLIVIEVISSLCPHYVYCWHSCQKLQKFMSMDGLDVDCKMWAILQYWVPQGKNMNDCGIHCCQWIKHLAFRVPLPDWWSEDCNDFRIMMFVELGEGELRWEDAFGRKVEPRSSYLDV